MGSLVEELFVAELFFGEGVGFVAILEFGLNAA